MGMFDRLKCNYPLPDEEIQREYFQTKDLINGLLEYEISKNGKLLKTRDFAEDDSWNTIELDEPELVNYTGCVNFYTFLNHHQIRNTWYEYQAYFVNGNLENLEKINVKN